LGSSALEREGTTAASQRFVGGFLAFEMGSAGNARFEIVLAGLWRRGPASVLLSGRPK
jgi:hypothetical protein